MSKRWPGNLSDELDWRIRLLNYGLAYMQSDIGRDNWERTASDIGMLAVEMWQIVEDNGIKEDELGHQGPVGPLPPGLSGALE